MPNISLIQKNGEYKYPATITEAVVDLNKRKKLSTLLDELSDKDFKGKVNQSTDISGLHDYKQGWHWIVNTAGRYVGQDCEVGDMIYCIQDFNALYLISDFEVLQSNVTYITNELIDELLHGYNPGGAIPYYKPEGGIPEEDLSTELLNKINKTDALATVATTGNYNDLINAPDLSSKADKDSDAVEGNIAIFDNTGNPVDSGKTFPIPYEDLYLTFEIVEDGVVGFSKNIQYSTDDGKTWNESSGYFTLEVHSGEKILWKGNLTPGYLKGIGLFSIMYGQTAAKYSAFGNVMSLLYGDDFKGLKSLEGKDYVFKELFGSNGIIDASNLILPATTLSNHCYYYMFYNCNSLIKTPKLPATTLVEYCYDAMFRACDSLEVAPELQATTLAYACYYEMFGACYKLKKILLPAETLVPYCYLNMISNQNCVVKLGAVTMADLAFSGWPYRVIVVKKHAEFNGFLGDRVYTESEWEVVRHYELSSYYAKPNGGIPKSDLSSEVKTSLGKADTALQSFTETDPTVPAWAKQPSKPTYTAQEVGALPSSTPIPTKTSDLTNDSGFLTQHQDISGKQDVIDDLQTIRSGAAKGETALQSFTETDPTVPSWAKQQTKPSYTASEVGALPDTTKYAGSQSAGGAANKAMSIPIGVVDSSSTSSAYTATVDGITELREGIYCALKLNRANTFGTTLNVNNLGAKPVYISTDANVISGNMMKANSFCIFVYTNRIEGGCWEFYGGYNSDFVGKCLGDYSGMYKMKEACKGRVLLVMYSESELLPLYSGEQDTGTNKTLTTESFDPFGEIFYTASSFNKDSYINLYYTWKQYYVDMRYAFNVGTTLENRKSIYMVCVPQSDGRVKLASNPISQTLPTTEDGFLYILLGTTYSNKDIELFMNHPIYYFKDGAIRLWTNQDTTALKLGTSTVGGTTQGIYLNQGVPTTCESYDMWYMKHIAALYGATRNDATGLWSYYYTNCARWDDTQEKIVWDRNIGYDDITDEEMMDMCDHRLLSLQGVYGYAKAMHSRIALHFIGYGNNQGAAQPCAYIGNNHVVTYGYIGQKGGANGNSYFPWHLQDTFLVSKVKNVIGRSGPSGATVTAPAGSLLEYATVTFNANNQTLNFGTCPNIEFVSIMYTLTDNGGRNRTGCTLILHPDVYAKIFDSTNADYALWHKIDLANQARTNPITILSA